MVFIPLTLTLSPEWRGNDKEGVERFYRVVFIPLTLTLSPERRGNDKEGYGSKLLKLEGAVKGECCSNLS